MMADTPATGGAAVPEDESLERRAPMGFALTDFLICLTALWLLNRKSY